MKTHSGKYCIWSGMLVVSAAAMTLEGCGASEQRPIADIPAKVIPATVMEVRLGAAPESTSAVGTIRAMYNSTLSSKVSGRVISVSAREGDKVRQGQILVQIDSRELQAAAETAQASYHASLVGVDSAKTAAEMEARTDLARIAQAQSQIQQAKALLASAEARRDLVKSGPRKQEVTQSHIAVEQAESNLRLARIERDRVDTLVKQGAMAGKELDLAQNRYELAEGQFRIAVQSENMAVEGSRTQDIRTSEEAVSQAKAALREAKTGLAQAQASSLQTVVKRKQIDVATAQSLEAKAAVQAAQVGLSYSQILAPFDGRLTLRSVDPGTMAGVGVPIVSVEGGEYRLEAVVPESIIPSIRVGDSEFVTVDALPNKSYKGRVAEIAPQGDGTTHSFLVRLSLGQPTGLKSGMYGRVRFHTGAKEKILIPRTSTWEREGLAYIYVVGTDSKAHLRIVTLGEKYGDSYEVLSGLGPGDKLIVSDPKQIQEGAKVEADRS